MCALDVRGGVPVHSRRAVFEWCTMHFMKLVGTVSPAPRAACVQRCAGSAGGAPAEARHRVIAVGVQGVGRAAQDRRAPGDMVEVLAEKVVAAGQSLLRTVAELKRRALLSDAAGLNAAVAERCAAHRGAADGAAAALRTLRDEVASTVQARWQFRDRSRAAPKEDCWA